MYLQPGDVLCTRNLTGIGGRLIRLGAALLDRPNTVNHVAIYTHTDAAGVRWCIEATGRGVGWQRADAWVKSRWTLNNARQPKTDAQRAQVVEVARSMLGTPYDYTGIALNAFAALGLLEQWEDDWGNTVPARVVCSSLADYVYETVGLDSPGLSADTRLTTPGDWAQFITEGGWHRP